MKGKLYFRYPETESEPDKVQFKILARKTLYKCNYENILCKYFYCELIPFLGYNWAYVCSFIFKYIIFFTCKYIMNCLFNTTRNNTLKIILIQPYPNYGSCLVPVNLNTDPIQGYIVLSSQIPKLSISLI